MHLDILANISSTMGGDRGAITNRKVVDWIFTYLKPLPTLG